MAVGIGSLDEAREEERPTVGRTALLLHRNTVYITAAMKISIEDNLFMTTTVHLTAENTSSLNKNSLGLLLLQEDEGIQTSKPYTDK